MSVWSDRRTRVICITGEISQDKAGDLMACLNDFKGKDIKLIINSWGGDEVAGFAMYDALRLYQGHIATIVIGQCESSALLPFLAGDARYVSPSSILMIHHGTIQVSKPTYAPEFIEWAREFDRSNNKYMHIVSERTGMTFSAVEKAAQNSTHYNPEQAVKAGYAHRIAEFPRRPDKTGQRRKGTKRPPTVA